MRIILYQARQNEVGGVETFNLNFCKRMSKYYNITFLCDSGDPEQLKKLEKYVDVVIYNEQVFETDVCIYSSCWGKRPEDHIKAKRYIQMVHADFTGIEKYWDFKYMKTPKVTEHLGGGVNIAKTFEKKYGYSCGVIPYLLDNERKVQPVLHLISTTRIAKEKGMHRVVKMARALKASGRKFNWDIWGSGFDKAFVDKIKKQLVDIPEVSFRGLGKDLSSFVADADYLVQLSDSEGYCFAIYEALSLNTPCIVTDFPNAREQVTDGENGYIVDMDLGNLDIDKLYDHIPQFEFKELASEEDWITVLGKPDKSEKKNIITEPEKVALQVSRNYNDVILNRKVKRGEILYELPVRAAELLKNHVAKKIKVVK